jgi:hypothetical protein
VVANLLCLVVPPGLLQFLWIKILLVQQVRSPELTPLLVLRHARALLRVLCLAPCPVKVSVHFHHVVQLKVFSYLLVLAAARLHLVSPGLVLPLPRHPLGPGSIVLLWTCNLFPLELHFFVCHLHLLLYFLCFLHRFSKSSSMLSSASQPLLLALQL